MKKYGQADLMIFLVRQYISEQMKDVPESQRKQIEERCYDEITANYPTSREYLMNYKGIAPPTAQYYNGIKKGYEDNGMNTKYLHDALVKSVEYQQEELCESEEFMEDDLQMSLE